MLVPSPMLGSCLFSSILHFLIVLPFARPVLSRCSVCCLIPRVTIAKERVNPRRAAYSCVQHCEQEHCKPARLNPAVPICQCCSQQTQLIAKFWMAACCPRLGALFQQRQIKRNDEGIHATAILIGTRASSYVLKPSRTQRLASLHLSSLLVPVSWICFFCSWSLLLWLLFCIFISALHDLFSFSPLCLLPPALPWRSAWRGVKVVGMVQASLCLCWFFSMGCLHLQSDWKRKVERCWVLLHRWQWAIQGSRGVNSWAVCSFPRLCLSCLTAHSLSPAPVHREQGKI